MNDLLKEVESLKNMIILSDEYKNYEKSLNKVDNNLYIKKLTAEIKSIQKKIVYKENKKEDTAFLEKKLDELYKDLYNDEDYSNYINSSVKLNKLITKIQKKFENYFNSLIS